MSPPSPLERASRILCFNRYLTLAVAADEKVWAAPIAYVVQIANNQLTLVYYSATRALHSNLISRNHRCAGAIFDSTASSDDADGIQFSGFVDVIEGASLPSIMAHYFLKSFPDPLARKRWQRAVSDFLHGAPQRFYRITVEDMWVPDTAVTHIDLRVQVSVADLIPMLKDQLP